MKPALRPGLNQLLLISCERELQSSPSLSQSTREAGRQARAAQKLASHELLKHEVAVVDVTAYHPYLPIEFLLDVMIRHPSVVLHEHITLDLAAAGGDRDKFVRYPATRGNQCTSCANEALGRLGDLSYGFLVILHTHARNWPPLWQLPRQLAAPDQCYAQQSRRQTAVRLHVRHPPLGTSPAALVLHLGGGC